MLKLFRSPIDPGLVVALLLAAFAAWPLLTRPSLPTDTDADLHIYRTQQIMAAWDQGVLYPRWAPDFAFGFGYPVFNYYAPLTYYLGAAYGRFFGGPVAGVKFVLVTAAGLGAVGLYLFLRELWGGGAGLVGAAVFSLAPYLVYIDPHARGAAPETFALALGPWLLWAFARLRRSPSPRRASLTALILAALILSHNLMSFLLAGLAMAWLAWEVVLERVRLRAEGRPPARRLWPLWAAALLGMGLSAFMWLPATLERGAVQFQRAFVDVSRPDAHLQFVSASELFAPASTADLEDLRVSGWKFQLGVGQWVLGGLGMLTIFSSRTQRSTVLFFGIAAAVLIGLMLPVSASIWKAIPLLTYLQLPWRLMGPTAMALGVLAGAATHWVEGLLSPWSRGAFGVVALTALIAGAMPLLDPLPWADYGPVTPQRLWLFEGEGNIGTTAQNEFLPAGVAVMPTPQASLNLSYQTGMIDKVDRTALPAGTQVTVVEHGPQHDRFQIAGQTSFDLRVLTFYFPGWTAYVDGVKTPIVASEPEGFITLPVPAGAHGVLVRLEDTSLRRLGWIVSGLALAVTLGLTVWPFRLFSYPPFAKHPFGSPDDAFREAFRREETLAPEANRSGGGLGGEVLAWRPAAAIGVIVIAALGVRYLADRASPWQVDLPTYDVPGAQHSRFVRLEGNIALLAYDLPQMTARPGDQVSLTLYWKALGRVPQDLSVFVHLIGPDGQLWGQSDKVSPVEYFPTSRWPLNRYFHDEHQVVVRADAPVGDYQVVVGLWNRYTGIRMHVLDSNGNVTDRDGIVLTTTFTIQPR